jgi:hypothetical protein
MPVESAQAPHQRKPDADGDNVIKGTAGWGNEAYWWSEETKKGEANSMLAVRG